MEKKKVVYRAVYKDRPTSSMDRFDSAMPRQTWKALCDNYSLPNTAESIVALRNLGWSVKRVEIPVEEPASAVVEGWPTPESSGWERADSRSNDERVCAIVSFLFAIFLLCLMGAAAALHI